jgi:hypothetical protein
MLNLGNLEVLILSSKPWFIFNETPHPKIRINDCKILKAKLPKLKSIHLYIASLDEDRMEQYRRVTPGLVKKFREGLVEKKWGRTYLNISTSP